MNVQRNDRLIINFAGRQMALPLDNEGNADATLPNLGLKPPQRVVARGGARRRPPVVANEENKGVFLEFRVAQFF